MSTRSLAADVSHGYAVFVVHSRWSLTAGVAVGVAVTSLAPPGTAEATATLIVMPYLTAPTAAVRDSFVEAARDLRDEGWLSEFPVDEVAANLSLLD